VERLRILTPKRVRTLVPAIKAMIGDVLSECTRVREELGWPIMVTPFSQLVGVQATLNVIEGERYARVPDEVKRYCFGYYGKLLAPVQPDVLDRIAANGSRGIALEPPVLEPALPALKRQHPNANGDELLLKRAFAPHLLDDRTPEKSAVKGAGAGDLVAALEATRNVGAVRVTTPKLEVSVVRR